MNGVSGVLAMREARTEDTPEAGFTFIELLIAMFIGFIMVAGSLGLLDLTRESSRTERLRLELQQNARHATDMVTRDLQQAGQGMDPNTAFGIVASVDGSAGQPDSLFILYIEPGTPDHVVLAPTPGLEKSQVILKITCGDPVDDVATGDFMYLASGSARGVAHVTGVNRSAGGSCGGQPPTTQIGTATLSVAPVDGETHGWVLQANTANAVGLRVRAVAYFLDTTNPTDPYLVRATSYQGGAWQRVPVADLISDFQVDLLFSDGDAAPEADAGDADPTNDHDDVNTVRVTFDAQTRWRDKDLAGGQTYARSYSLSVTPRNQLYTRNLGG
jgi:type II secretory pathway pseudopilin PulG